MVTNAQLPKNSIINNQLGVNRPLSIDNWINLPVPAEVTSPDYKSWVAAGSSKVLFFGELAQYMYTTAEKYMGVFNGTLPEKDFYKPGVALHAAALWCLEDMIADAKSKGISISYSSFYKKLSVQETDFKKLNSKTPTKVSKASSSPQVRDGRTWAGNKWYPITITELNTYPGYSPLGAGFSIKLKSNNEKVTKYIIDNGGNYGWSWSSDIPTSDPIFKDTLVYYAGLTKPLKYKDKTRREIPVIPQVWKASKETNSSTVGNGGKWVDFTPPPITQKTTQTTQALQRIIRFNNTNEAIPVNKFTTMVVNSTKVSRFAYSVRSTLNYLGINHPTIKVRTNYYSQFYPAWEGTGPFRPVGFDEFLQKQYTVSENIYSQIYDKFYDAESNLIYSSHNPIPGSSLEYWKNWKKQQELGSSNSSRWDKFDTYYNEGNLSFFLKPGGYIANTTTR